MEKGLFISFEGIDGSGKSTAAEKLCTYLSEQGREVVFTFEPGGCEWGKTMRNILLHGSYAPAPRTEALLFAADRAEHMAACVFPALARGAVVICDRFADSTIAYQGGGRGMDVQALTMLSDFAAAGRMPDITFLLALPVDMAAARRQGEEDRMEQEKKDFFQRVADSYEQLAAQNPERIVRIDATCDTETVWQQIKTRIDTILQD